RWLVRWAALAAALEVRRSGAEVARARVGVAGAVVFWVLLRDISTPVVAEPDGECRRSAEGGHGQEGLRTRECAARARRRELPDQDAAPAGAYSRLFYKSR